jgi:hypothetical protein
MAPANTVSYIPPVLPTAAPTSSIEYIPPVFPPPSATPKPSQSAPEEHTGTIVVTIQQPTSTQIQVILTPVAPIEYTTIVPNAQPTELLLSTVGPHGPVSRTASVIDNQPKATSGAIEQPQKMNKAAPSIERPSVKQLMVLGVLVGGVAGMVG